MDEQQEAQANFFEQQQQEISEATQKVERAGELSDKDKEVAKQSREKRKSMSDEEAIVSLQNELSDFLHEKLDIDNRDGGNIERLPTGIDVLDAIAGGGFGLGRFTMIVGNPGTFKSALLASVIAHCQRKFKNKLLTVYHDSESAMSLERLAALGVNRPTIKPYDTDVTIESVFQSIQAVGTFKELRKMSDYPAIIAWDSIANTPCEKDKTTDDINQTVGLKARILSGLLTRYISRLTEHNISLIAVNQLRESMAMGPFAGQANIAHMGGKEIPGGNSIQYNAFHLLHLKNRGDIKAEQFGFPGIKLEAEFKKNKFFRPFVPVTLIADINHGISNFWSNFMFLVDNKLLSTGIWCSMINAPQFKFHYKDAFNLYKTEPGFKQAFDDLVKKTIQTEIVEKYKVNTTSFIEDESVENGI